MTTRRDIKEWKGILHNMASNPPSCDPFTFAGAQVWQEWSQGCRDAETALRDAGEEL